MAFGSSLHGLISRWRSRSQLPEVASAFPMVWAAFLTLLIAGPWLLPGYLFGTDWPGPRQILFPTEVSSSAPLQAALAMVSLAIGGEATGKLLVVALLFI